MTHVKVQLARKQADGYVVPLGPVNLVSVVTDVGMVGCGAFDVGALNNFSYRYSRIIISNHATQQFSGKKENFRPGMPGPKLKLSKEVCDIEVDGDVAAAGEH